MAAGEPSGPTLSGVQATGRGMRPVLGWLVLGNVLAIGLVALLCMVSLDASRKSYRQSALDAADTITLGVEQGLEALLGRIDTVLRLAVRDQRLGSDAAHAAWLAQAIANHQTLLPEGFELVCTDALGRVRETRGGYTAGADLGDRAFFRQVRDAATGALVISDPALDALNGQWGVVVARRLETLDGAFAGVVFVPLASAQIATLLAAVKIGPQGAVTVRTTGLRLVTRRIAGESTPPYGSSTVSAELSAALKQQPGSGTYIARTMIDQVERANAYRQVTGYPFIVIAGLATADYLAPWRQQALNVAALALLAAAALIGSSWMAYRAWRGEASAAGALQRESERHLAFMRTASDGIYVLDRSGRLVDLNEAFASMLGQPRGELLGRPVADWDAQFWTSSLQDMARHFQVGELIRFSTQHRRQDGTLLDIETTGTCARVADQDLIYVSARDVTARKRAESALRASEALLERTGRVARVGGWEVDLSSRDCTLSDRTRRILELPSDHQPRLQALLDLYPPGARQSIDAAFNEAVDSHKPWDLELPLVTVRGRSIWVRSIGEVEFEDGRPMRLVGALQDITDDLARRAELEREQSMRQQIERHAQDLQQALIERSEMLDVMAHEVRQPLNNASAALQSAALALEGKGEQSASIRLQRAQDVMGRVLAGIDNTLAAAALLSGQEPIALQDADIDTLIGVAVGDLAPADRLRVHIDRQTATRTARMDTGLMRLALRNLLANALKYSSPDTSVTLRVIDSDEPLALILEVADAGPGFADDLLPRLFERGQRRPLGGGGHGLGLYIVRRVMQLHGGQVELVRNGADGSTMRLVITQTEA